MSGRPSLDEDDLTLTDDELGELAMAADPEAPLDPDAVPMVAIDADGFPSLLPAWYMPLASSAFRSRRRAAVVAVVVVSLLVLNAFGFCITNGYLEIP